MIKNKIYENYDDFDDDLEDVQDEFIDIVGNKPKDNTTYSSIDTNRAGSRSMDIYEQDALEYIQNECTNFISLYKKYGKSICLYRGINSQDDYMYIQPSKYNRIPVSGNKGFYNYIIDESVLWNKYPKRSKSIFAVPYNINNKTTLYGHKYVVIPFDNANIGICSKEDLWYSFEKIYKEMKVNLLELDNILESYKLNYKNLSEFKIQLNKLKDKNEDEYLNYNEKVLGKLFKLSKANNLDNFKMLELLMDPKDNGFKKIKYDGNYNDIKNITGEVWTDSDCIIVKYELIEKLMNKIQLNENIKDNEIYDGEQVGYNLKINNKTYHTINGFKNMKFNPIKFKVKIINNKIYTLDNILLCNDNFK